MGIKNRDYQNPDVVKRIYELKSEGESVHEISRTIKEEFGLPITDPTVKNIYNRYVSKQLLVNAENQKKASAPIVEDYQAKMDARFDKVAKVTDEMMELLQNLKGTMDPKEYAKYVPLVLAVSREILAQLTFIKREQSQISITQKNMIYSPLQIMQVLNKEIVKLEKDGKIQLIKTSKDGRILTEEERKDPVFSRPKCENEIELEEAE
jgi:hypothetical protein